MCFFRFGASAARDLLSSYLFLLWYIGNILRYWFHDFDSVISCFIGESGIFMLFVVLIFFLFSFYDDAENT